MLDDNRFFALLAVAVAVAVGAWFACDLWASSVRETPMEAGDRAAWNLQRTIDALEQGTNPRAVERREPPVAPWPARNPYLVALIVGAVIVLIGSIPLYLDRERECWITQPT